MSRLTAKYSAECVVHGPEFLDVVSRERAELLGASVESNEPTIITSLHHLDVIALI